MFHEDNLLLIYAEIIDLFMHLSINFMDNFTFDLCMNFYAYFIHTDVPLIHVFFIYFPFAVNI